MAYHQPTAERVRRALSRRRNVVEKGMVGGISFLVNGQMCCGVTQTGLMVRVGPEALEATLAEPHVRPVRLGGRRLAAFVGIDPDGYRTAAALAKWLQRGLDFVSTLEKPRRQPS